MIDETYMLAEPPSTLVFGRREADNVSTIGAFPKATSESWRGSIFTLPGPDHCPFPSHNFLVNFSSAPLRDITSVRVYYKEGHPRSRGVMFTYRNDAQRALGECRLGVDRCRAYENPRFMCTLATITDRQISEQRELRTVEIQFADRCTHGDEDGGWDCYEMKGTLRFWFTHHESHLKVVPN